MALGASVRMGISALLLGLLAAAVACAPLPGRPPQDGHL